MNKELPTGVIVAIVVVVLVVIGWFGWTRMSGPKLSKADEERFLKPVTLGPGTNMPAPPPPSGGPGLVAPAGGGAPMPPAPR